MLKQKIDTAALFAQKKTEVQSSARTLLILDGQENAYISADELTEELLAIPEEGAIWLDMSLFGFCRVVTSGRAFFKRSQRPCCRESSLLALAAKQILL